MATIRMECSLVLLRILAVTSEYGMETRVIQNMDSDIVTFEEAIILSSPNGAT